MAQQTINIGTTANDGTGDPIRSAFDKSNDNFTELYGAGALSIASDILTYTKADGTTSTVDLSPYLDEDARAIASGTINGSGIVTFTRDDATTFTLDLSSLLDDTNLITSVNTQTGAVVLDADDIDDTSTTNKFTSSADISKLAGIEAGAEVNTVDSVNTQTGAVVLDSDDIAQGSTNLYNQTHTGDVTGSTALTIASGAVTNAKMAANSIDSDQYVDGSIDTAHFSLTAAINTVTDQNTGTLKLWSGSQASYDALTPDASTIYFIV